MELHLPITARPRRGPLAALPWKRRAVSRATAFCERCGYTSIRARGTKACCTASAAKSPKRPRRSQCGLGLTEAPFHIAAKIRSSKQTPWVHSAHTALNNFRASAVRATCGCLRWARRAPPASSARPRHGRFAHHPAQLARSGAHDSSAALVRSRIAHHRHQAGVVAQTFFVRETVNVSDLSFQHQRRECADSWNAHQTACGGIFFSDLPQLLIERVHFLIQLIHQAQAGVDRLARRGPQRQRLQPGAAGAT